MKKKVVALGNSIMMDDAVGVKVTRILKKWMQKNGLEVIIGETDTAYCLSRIENDDYLIIIDASYFHVEPGKVMVFPISALQKKPIKRYSQHEMNLLELLRIEGKKVNGYFICIEINRIDFGFGLSSSLESKFVKICEEVKKEIKIILEGLSYA